MRRFPWSVLALLGLIALLLTGLVVWRDDISRTQLDPKTPFQAYRPPRAPNYDHRAAWALLPVRPGAPGPADGDADIFFVHPTTYDGGPHWVSPIRNQDAERSLERIMLPNFAGAFRRTGRVFAPRYRHASLYSLLTLRDDAREARAFPYADVRRAFFWWVRHAPERRPVVMVGVEQGGLMIERLLDEIASSRALKDRVVAVYLIQTWSPADRHGPGSAFPACARRDQAGCVVAYYADGPSGNAAAVRPLVWKADGLAGPREGSALCVNPVTGSVREPAAPARSSLGAVNATGLEWGARPALLSRQISTRCQEGRLIVSRPRSASLRPAGSWTDRRKMPGFNLFFGDLEADSLNRLAAWARVSAQGGPAPPITRSIAIRNSPIHRID